MKVPYGSSVKVIRQSVDEFGDPQSEETHTVSDCIFNPEVSSSLGTSTEDHDLKRQLVQRATLYLPVDADIKFTDQLEIDGQRWWCDGAPSRYTSPFTGWAPGASLEIKRVVG